MKKLIYIAKKFNFYWMTQKKKLKEISIYII